MDASKAKQKRKSYTIKDKLAVIAEHEEGVSGSGFHALGIKHDRLPAWILDRNAKGLRVKDSYIRLQAQNIYRKLHGPDAPKFDASTGWLVRFKKTKQLVSRRQTTTRTLSGDAAETCRDFIQRVQQLFATHNIQSRNIINMDQVPRYFETEPKTTIATRGSREVLLRKGGTSHKVVSGGASGQDLRTQSIFGDILEFV
ncbi:hypothetical protein PHYSODRAFT_486359 [Phytophthora sojae]|uniref:HTH CENPB-type domain-containing protein n=1 Tax=Phytophthora sojae (strain P6497) TaxID=1094619 RepID=G4YWA9_PHYSP|nr:hypothetical protein PHYSODRAFT_486359 [Phytophthora sojae]EGZ24999.1 hypothetical protein PHYSODRAFT_486359 [Phytophthora sojae]|eukprot:XP_009520287.1 hypothetical protein PHYSODRAFT_486359 [Phytophthora sojae]